MYKAQNEIIRYATFYWIEFNQIKESWGQPCCFG